MTKVVFDAEQAGPTPYPDVNAVLHQMLYSIQAILSDRFRGMYLDGSLALGDFSPHSSDIDYVVVTSTELADEEFSALRAMHARFNAGDSPWATEVEAFYVPQDAMWRCGPKSVRCPRIERGPSEILYQYHLDSSWVVHLHILREHSVAIAGPAPDTFIDRVDPQEIRDAARDLVAVWWGSMSMAAREEEIQRLGSQVYNVLTLCRVLYSLGTGAVASKRAAAHWARHELGARWPGLVERAVAWRKDRDGLTPAEDIAGTLGLIEFTLDRCRS